MRIRIAWLFLSAVLGALPLSVGAQGPPDTTHGVREFVASGTWRVPAGVERITIELWGGGGGGAGGASALANGGPGGGGGGGGSGAYIRASLSVREGETYTISIGAAGAAGRGESRNAAQPGGDGGDSTLSRNGNLLLVAHAGSGGSPPRRRGYNGGAGGTGGEALATEGILVRQGNSGTPGHDASFNDEARATSGGRGGPAVLGTLQPPGSFGGNGGAGSSFSDAPDGQPGGTGSAVISW
ncbi:MAG: glycine-rich domain-containing protein [Vicinamibacterales bacterium]